MRAQLPREHSEALALARRLERADDRTAPEHRRALLLYWYGTGAAHLRAEEHVLLTAWERHGGADHPLHASIRADHARLADAIARIAADARPAVGELRRAGRDLAAHVHRQERELAAVVEHEVPPEELVDVGRALDAARFPA